MYQAIRERRTGIRGQHAAVRATRLALENHQRFNEQSLRNSAHAHRRSMEAQHRLYMDRRRERGDSGLIGTIVGLLILVMVSYGAYEFVVSSGLLP